MAKIHRMNTTEHRLWRQNTPQLVGEDGAIVRALLLEEEQAASTLSKKAAKKKTTLEQTFNFSDPTAEGGKRQSKIRIDVVVIEDGARTSVSVDGMKRVTTRDIMRKRFFDMYGCDVQLRMPNGVYVGSVRDPNKKRPTSQDANRAAPRPEFCQCKDWGAPHPGRHHRICEWNKVAPPDERALESTEAADVEKRISENQLEEAKPNVTSGLVAATMTHSPGVAPAEQELAPDPANCQCKDWARPEGADPNMHHPICQHRELWEKQNAHRAAQDRPVFFLYDLDGDEAVREATPEEVKEAEHNEQTTGLRSISIGEAVYVVLAEGEEPPRNDPEDTEDEHQPIDPEDQEDTSE